MPLVSVWKEVESDESFVIHGWGHIPSARSEMALYRVITGEVEVPQLSVDVRYELGKVGFVKPAFGHTPDEFNEQHRPFIEQWFKLNPL